jgi:hypothetical protein
VATLDIVSRNVADNTGITANETHLTEVGHERLMARNNQSFHVTPCKGKSKTNQLSLTKNHVDDALLHNRVLDLINVLMLGHISGHLLSVIPITPKTVNLIIKPNVAMSTTDAITSPLKEGIDLMLGEWRKSFHVSKSFR